MALTFVRHGSNGALILGALLLLVLMVTGRFLLSFGWIVVGAALFYLSEYSWHRFVFHAAPSRWAGLRTLQRRLHYDHHLEPDRLDLLFLPIWFVVPNLVVTSLIIVIPLGEARLPSVLLGIILAILHYEWVHYVAHVPYTPRTAFGAWMKRYHLRHHFISEKLWFGVSNPALDWAYGTWRSPKDVERSATVRALHSDDRGRT